MKPDAVGPATGDVPFADHPAMRGSKAFLPDRLQEGLQEGLREGLREAPQHQVEIPRASLAFGGEGHFVLDAEPEDLKWSPRTISVAAGPRLTKSTCL